MFPSPTTRPVESLEHPSGESPVVRGGASPFAQTHGGRDADRTGDGTGRRCTGLGGGQAQRVVLFFQVTRQQSGGDDREHQARVHAVVELLDQGGQHDAAQDRTVDVPILVISQFTLYGDTRKGRRPSWAHAAPGDEAEPLVDAVVADLRGRGLHVETGQFGAMMEVSLVNDGPFTVLVEA